MTQTLLFDIETDGLYWQATKLHCIALRDPFTGHNWLATDASSDIHPAGATIVSLDEGLRMLTEAEEIIGHNVIKYDIPMIQRLRPGFNPKGKVFDTLVAAKVIWPDIKEIDYAKRKKLLRTVGPERMNKQYPGSIIGRHGLDAWGYRLGEWKGDYAAVKEQELKDIFHERHMAERATGKLARDCSPKLPTAAEKSAYVWGTVNKAMLEYAIQDVVVTEKLWRTVVKKGLSDVCLDLEHRFAQIMSLMERQGFCFDKAGAVKLEETLLVRQAQLTQELQKFFPPWVEETTFTPKNNNGKLGYKKGVEVTKKKTVMFNAGSRDHIANRLIAKYGWKPSEFTDTGKPKVDEDVLSKLDYPETDLLVEAATIQKRLGQLSEGKQSWLGALMEDGRIHGEIDTNGAVTGRCTHKRPNIAQVPANDKPYGHDCRALFGPPPGMVQIGADLSGLELRCLAHFMSRYDEGAYIDVLLNGDVHSFNAAALFGYSYEDFRAGLDDDETLLIDVANDYPHSGRYLQKLNPGQRKVVTLRTFFTFLRNNAKTFIYGFLYGAGAEKIGEIIEGGAAEGKRLIKQFLDGTPAIRELRAAVARFADPWAYKVEAYMKDGVAKTKQVRVPNPEYRGYLVGLDKRQLPIRAAHAALNTLLQSAGALISKKATVILYDDMLAAGHEWGKDWGLMAHIHDEVQAWSRPEIAEEAGKIFVEAFRKAGEFFEFRCPIAGEFKIGRNWAETH